MKICKTKKVDGTIIIMMKHEQNDKLSENLKKYTFVEDFCFQRI